MLGPVWPRAGNLQVEPAIPLPAVPAGSSAILHKSHGNTHTGCGRRRFAKAKPVPVPADPALANPAGWPNLHPTLRMRVESISMACIWCRVSTAHQRRAKLTNRDLSDES